MDAEESAFRQKLEESHVFPTLYMFKFIVPNDKEEAIKSIFPKNELLLKPSSGGKYISATAKIMVSSADHIIDIYKEAKKIEGIISL